MLNKDRLFTAICNSFQKIEVQDIRVSKVLLSYKAIHTLLQDPYILMKNIECNGLPRKSNDHLATLFGAKVYPCKNIKESKVIGGNGFEYASSPVLYYNTFNSLNIIVKSRAEFTCFFSPEEWTALYTLREMISEYDFRKFLKYGFILVTGKSGQVYQIFRIDPHVKVWEKGKLIKEVCVYLSDKNIPKTDKLIAFKIIIETDEESFLKMGNVYNINESSYFKNRI